MHPHSGSKVIKCEINAFHSDAFGRRCGPMLSWPSTAQHETTDSNSRNWMRLIESGASRYISVAVALSPAPLPPPFVSARTCTSIQVTPWCVVALCRLLFSWSADHKRIMHLIKRSSSRSNNRPRRHRNSRQASPGGVAFTYNDWIKWKEMVLEMVMVSQQSIIMMLCWWCYYYNTIILRAILLRGNSVADKN